MNAKERIIRAYFLMTDLEKATIVYDYHLKMQRKKGVAIQGHYNCHAHSIKHTAKEFNMSTGRVAQMLKIARNTVEYKKLKM